MNINRLYAWLGVVALFWSGAAGAAEPTAPATDGLVRQTARDVDELYLRPGADFSRYNRVMLAPVEVAFAPDWEKQHSEISAADSLRIRSDMAALARDEFTRQLQGRAGGKGPGYPVVLGAAPDVLDVRASIVDLDITAPDTGDPLRHVYVFSAGKGRLVAELRDSQTGTLLARVVDSREARDYPDFQVANRVTNSAEARQIVGLWSRLLRRYLDAARHPDADKARPTP
jgi:Protein of unknown function (DUF3313)